MILMKELSMSSESELSTREVQESPVMLPNQSLPSVDSLNRSSLEMVSLTSLSRRVQSSSMISNTVVNLSLKLFGRTTQRKSNTMATGLLLTSMNTTQSSQSDGLCVLTVENTRLFSRTLQELLKAILK
uniref:Uncharacterized protein n=2 Tax=Cacopsylla melanoneura TaxID=428564 RepID=A0A8D8WMS6_9HEMI